jgi:hypothetical protein
MDVIDSEFRLKGSRNYIHGTDMYTAFVRHTVEEYPAPDPGALKMTIHRIATRNSSMLVGLPGEEFARPPDAYAEFSAELPGGLRRAYLVETGTPATERYEYHEERIEQLCTLREQTVYIREDSGYAPVEVVVAMNKHLHNSLFPLADERWMFTRIELKRPLRASDAQQFEVTHLQRLGTKFSRSAIAAAGTPLGHIYFSAVPK